MGQVPGVASPGDGTVWVFHRGSHAWGSKGAQLGSAAAGNGSANGAADDGTIQGPVILQVLPAAPLLLLCCAAAAAVAVSTIPEPA